ncbi:MAG: hypothetical protein HRT68_10245 [Flavobacteriaceae bacterium]|nr:hypothetical protein [Flavobacteriaceae bacterium]
MSKRIRENIGIWFFLLVGMLLIIKQVYKYFTNQLTFTADELIVLIVGCVVIFIPKALAEIFKNFIDQKLNNKNEQ